MDMNDIKATIRDAASTAGRKAGEIANKTKIKFALANLQGDLDELYEKLGRLYYEAVTQGINNGTKESAIITKIDSIKDDMEILKAEIGEFPRKGKICRHCGKNIPKNSSFCPYCGKDA